MTWNGSTVVSRNMFRERVLLTHFLVTAFGSLEIHEENNDITPRRPNERT